jgi:hypothetical protein
VKVILIVELLRAFVVENAVAVELIIAPFPVVGRVAFRVVENSPSIHLVLLKLTIVVSSILEKQLPFPMLFAVQRSPLITTTILIRFDCEDKFSLFLPHWLGK